MDGSEVLSSLLVFQKWNS